MAFIDRFKRKKDTPEPTPVPNPKPMAAPKDRPTGDILMGSVVRDKLSGIQGTVSAFVYDISGSLTVGVTPTATRGKVDTYDYDIERLELVADAERIDPGPHAKAAAALRQSIQLGAVYKHSITGQKGVCTTKIYFFGGCTAIHCTLADGATTESGKTGFSVSAELAELVDAAPAAKAAERATPTGGPTSSDRFMDRF